MKHADEEWVREKLDVLVHLLCSFCAAYFRKVFILRGATTRGTCELDDQEKADEDKLKHSDEEE